MNILIKIKLQNLECEIENLKHSLAMGDKSNICASISYAKFDLDALGNIARNLSENEIKENISNL